MLFYPWQKKLTLACSFLQTQTKEQYDHLATATDINDLCTTRKTLTGLSRCVLKGAYKDFLVCVEFTKLRLAREGVVVPSGTNTSRTS